MKHAIIFIITLAIISIVGLSGTMFAVESLYECTSFVNVISWFAGAGVGVAALFGAAVFTDWLYAEPDDVDEDDGWGWP